MTATAIIEAIVAFGDLEPEIQEGIVGLIHLFHKHTKSQAGSSAPVTASSGTSGSVSGSVTNAAK